MQDDELSILACAASASLSYGLIVGLVSLSENEFRMYTSINFKTKKDLKTAIAEGKFITVYQPNQMFPVETQNGKCYLEGPHYPQPHKWYAEGTLQNGRLINVK